MKLRYHALIGLFVVSLAGGLIWSANHYHTKYLDEKDRADKAEKSLTLAKQTINDIQTRQRDVAALDAKYTGELADAKATIEQLQRDVDAGRKRLQLNAKCPATGKTSTDGLGDASSPRLTDSAQRDYFTLRERIVTVTKQVAYLQDYINKQCFR